MKSIVLCDNGKLEKVLPLCDKYQLGIEIQGFHNTNIMETTRERIDIYKSILPISIERHLHAPFWDLCLGSNNKKIAEVTRYFFDYAYEIADELDCKSITVHHGYVPNTSSPQKWTDRAIAFWNDFLEAHPGSINLYMENQLEFNPDILVAIIDSLPDNRVAVNLDIGHAHCAGKIPVIEWIKQLSNRIKYVHLHQNNGIIDEHLGLTQGTIPMRKVLDALEEYSPNAVWALECNEESMEESIELLIKYKYIN